MLYIEATKRENDHHLSNLYIWNIYISVAVNQNVNQKIINFLQSRYYFQSLIFDWSLAESVTIL